MCGIIGYQGKEDAVPYILDGLHKLEYRGYDSAGIAVGTDSGIRVVKQKGRLNALSNALKSTPLSGNVGIGHTRWATHGEPSDVNSHPHLGTNSRIAVVHNGIIENYEYLRAMLQEKGVEFASETDSEIVAQLAEYYYNGNLLEVTIKIIGMLEGSFALGIMCKDEPNKLIAVKKDNPLIVGFSQNGNFIASDVPAILPYTNKVYYLGEKEIALLAGGEVEFFDAVGGSISRQPETILWNSESAEKGGYEHFMYKEILEQPKVVKDTFASFVGAGKNARVLQQVANLSFHKITVVACGSAYNVGMVGRYVLEGLTRKPVEVELASEFRYRDALVDHTTLVVVISQSGETADTVAAMREAKRKGAKTLAIVNVVGSTIGKEADFSLYTMAGPEIAVATTKALSAQLIVLYVLAVEFARNRLGNEECNRLLVEIEQLPSKIEEVFKQTNSVQHFASGCFNCKSIFFIGRNVDYAVALEGSLKLKEISYIHSEAYAGGELKHGTISLIEDNTLVVAIACNSKLFPKTVSNTEQVISRGARVLLLTNTPEKKETDKITTLTIPHCFEMFAPSLSVVILQLLAYYVAVNKGCDIDKPRNLAKSVTVE